VKFIECPQGSAEWLAARSGKITASCFADAISVCQKKSASRDPGEPTAVAERYAADLAIERISGQPHGEPPKAWVLERGHEMEAHARRIYEGRTGAFVTEAGICLTDDEVFGYSTDGLVDDDGLIEIKAPIDSTKILAMWQTGDTSEYDHQMQGGMWITGRKWCDFIMYVPDLAPVGKDLYVKRVFRDDAFIDDMAARLVKFDSMVQLFEGVLRSPADGAVDAEMDPDFQEVATAPAAPVQSEPVPEMHPVHQVLVDALERRRESQPALAAAVTSIDVARVAAAAPAAGATLRLGQINERFAPIALTAEGLARLGFAPAATDKSAKLYHEADFPAMCAALIRHVNAVAQAKAA
jgi:exodeoxyribonuclease (lambda-induced)